MTDPLLARLPAINDPNWRIGHLGRKMPVNYVLSLWIGENLLTDEKTYGITGPTFGSLLVALYLIGRDSKQFLKLISAYCQNLMRIYIQLIRK